MPANRIKKNVGFFAFSVVIIFGAFPAFASVFTIKNVPVDVRASSASKARTLAHQRGQAKAFKILLKKLTLAKDHPRIDDLNIKDASVYVKSLEVDHEKTSSVRYIADLTVHFNENLVREFLGFNQLDYAETESKPILILSVFEESNKTSLWEESNIWHDAWQKYEGSTTLIPLLVPAGDLTDIQDLSLAQVQAGDVGRFLAMAKRYGAGAVLVSRATLGRDPTQDRSVLNVEATFYGLDGAQQNFYQSFESNGGNLLSQAVETVTSALAEQWKTENLITANQSDELLVRVPFQNLSQWVTTRKILSKIGVVREMTLKEMARDYAMVKVRFSGSLNNLKTAFAQKDLNLTRGYRVWTLSRKG